MWFCLEQSDSSSVWSIKSTNVIAKRSRLRLAVKQLMSDCVCTGNQTDPSPLLQEAQILAPTVRHCLR